VAVINAVKLVTLPVIAFSLTISVTLAEKKDILVVIVMNHPKKSVINVVELDTCLVIVVQIVQIRMGVTSVAKQVI
jgi:hypothetical protein